MPKPTLIVLTGQMRSGKDETAKILMEHLPTFKRLALADPLKKILADIEGVTVDYIEQNKSNYREKLILTGKIGRALDPENWIKRLPHKQLYHKNSVITDVRFLNEFYFFKRLKKTHKTYFIKLQAQDSTRFQRGASPEFANDPSETELSSMPIEEYDYLIQNDSTVEDLKNEVLSFIKNNFESGV